MTARLAGDRAKFVPSEAINSSAAVERVRKALLHRPLIAWAQHDFAALAELAGHPDLAHLWPPYSPAARNHRNHAAAVVDELAQRWRGQLDVDGTLLPCLHPGSPDRLLLMLQRIANDD